MDIIYLFNYCFCRDLKLKGKEINSFSQAAKIPNPKSLKTKGSNEDSENKNPNIFAPIANDGC